MLVDDYVAGWAFLPDDGPRMHRTDPARPGWALCGRQLDPNAPVLQDPRRAFVICADCRAAGAQYPIPLRGRAADPPPARSRHRVVEGRALGWVQLPRPPRVLHRPDPYIPDRVICGQVLPGNVPIHRTPPQDWPACSRCQAKIDADPEEARRDRRWRVATASTVQTPGQSAGRAGRQRDRVPSSPDRAPRPPAVSARILRRLAALSVLGAGPTGTAGTWRLPVGWVRLDGCPVWHRPHPERPDRVMCELILPATVSVYRRRTTNEPACPDCDAVRARALSELRERERQRADGQPPAPTKRTTPPRPPRPRMVRGGLPTLGRDR
jgi:hypothetical protein